MRDSLSHIHNWISVNITVALRWLSMMTMKLWEHMLGASDAEKALIFLNVIMAVPSIYFVWTWYHRTHTDARIDRLAVQAKAEQKEIKQMIRDFYHSLPVNAAIDRKSIVKETFRFIASIIHSEEQRLRSQQPPLSPLQMQLTAEAIDGFYRLRDYLLRMLDPERLEKLIDQLEYNARLEHSAVMRAQQD